MQTSKKTFTYCVGTLNPFGGEDLFFLLLHLSCSRRFMASRHENRGENKVTLHFYPDHKSYLRRKTVGSDIYYIEVANHCTHQGLLSDVSDVSVIVSVSFLLLRSTRQLSLIFIFFGSFCTTYKLTHTQALLYQLVYKINLERYSSKVVVSPGFEPDLWNMNPVILSWMMFWMTVVIFSIVPLKTRPDTPETREDLF